MRYWQEEDGKVFPTSSKYIFKTKPKADSTGTYWFADETWQLNGPYPSYRAAVASMKDYAETL